jgi:hypothetical protein
MDESKLNTLITDINNEKTKLFNDLKNDTELLHEKVINSKLVTLDAMLKTVFKMRNILIKEKLTFKI